MRDLSNRTDIEIFVRSFYDRVKKDELLGPIFNDIAKVDWEKHLPVMFDFWEFTVLGTTVYSGNAMAPHFELHKKTALLPEHFARWLQIFNSTADALFVGLNTELMKSKAQNIAGLMEYKLNSVFRN